MKINPDQAPDVNTFNSTLITAINDTDSRVDGINGSTITTPAIAGVTGQTVASQLAYIWSHVLQTTGGTATGDIKAPNFQGDLNGVFYSVSTTQPTSPAVNDIWFDITNRIIKYWSGTAWTVLGSSSSSSIPDGSITTAKLADGAVTTPKLADGAVTSPKLADGAVLSAKIADVAIISSKIGDGAVLNSKIGDGSVNAAKIADMTITTVKLADGSVATGKLADGAVTTAKLASGITIPFANITGKPTTVAGYGITNAVTLSGGQTIAGTLAAANFIGKLNGSNLTVASAAPASPSANDLWIDTSTLSFKYYNGTAWVALGSSSGGGGTGTVPVVSALGTAAASSRGQMVLLQGASGAPDQLYVCMKLGNDTYDWVAT